MKLRDYRYSKNLIDGKWVPTKSGVTLDVEDPFTLETIGCAPLSDSADLDSAVLAAMNAFSLWKSSSIGDRQEVLATLKSVITENLEELALLWSYEVGTPITTARQASGFLPVRVLDDLKNVLDNFEFDLKFGLSTASRSPIGPAAAITPWNYPLSQFVIKSASAISAGCTVVAKPSEIAPLCAFRFMELATERGLPKGIINLVGGDGPSLGNALVKDSRIRIVSFTGSTTTGASIAALCGQRLIRACLELGGKSASIVLDEAILERAIENTLASCVRNSGQTCTSLTRLIVPINLVEQACDLSVEIMRKMIVGDPRDPKTQIGPLVSEKQKNRSNEIIESGIHEGAQRIFGALNDVELPITGHFVSPTIFRNVKSEFRIAREEIFAPVLSIFGALDEQDAIKIANESEYGLGGSVWSSDHDRAKTVSTKIDAGTITINGGDFATNAPYGGIKASGIGRELGQFGMEEFLEYRTYHGYGK
jgi:acyl-CoA reductase-like NAD-dependent aldehyde dehydrogenase